MTESQITSRVGAGSARSTLANMLSKVGMTKTSSTVTAITATERITPG